MTSSSELTLPFEHLNLTRNPFGKLSLKERANLTVGNFEKYAHFLEIPGAYVEFVGPSGRGKTCHLLALRDRQFPEAPFIRVRRDGDWEKKRTPVVFIDELQFMTPAQRDELSEYAGSVAVATHESLKAEFERDGYDVWTVEVGDVSADELGSMFDVRIQWCARNSGEVPFIEKSGLEWLIDEYGDNIRAMEHHLYNVFQNLEQIKGVTVRQLENAKPPPDEIVYPDRYRAKGGDESKS